MRNIDKIIITIISLILCLSTAHSNVLFDMSEIRTSHPRLFLNDDTFLQVKARAFNQEREQLQYIKQRVDKLQHSILNQENAEFKDLGIEAAETAFLFLLTEDEKYLELAKKTLDISIGFYEQRYEDRLAVNWYSISRLHAVIALDWLYNHLSDKERQSYMSRIIANINNVMNASPAIPREHPSGYASGFYGYKNLLWYIGLTTYNTALETDLTNEWLQWGYAENMRMLEYRRACAGVDGGSPSGTITYSFAAYPWAEFNFLYTVESATGKSIAQDWQYIAMITNYMLWNWIPAEPAPLCFGYGDIDHLTNEYPIDRIYSHMANIQHFYSESTSDYVGLAKYIQDMLPKSKRSHQVDIGSWMNDAIWFFYPFIQIRRADEPEIFEPESLPMARNFEQMGQIFMRSGSTKDDTYALFTCGGNIANHKHYDSLNFVIYHKGFQALDSGTRWRHLQNVDHLTNYYAQTVAHNCVLIHQPQEPTVPFWGNTAKVNYGGQHKVIGSVVKGFETNEHFVYIAGDATDCYRQGPCPKGRPLGSHDTNPPTAANPDLPDKAELVARQFVFLPPHHFVIFDRVKSTSADYRKDWLIHTANEPIIKDKTIKAEHNEGRMFCQTLLPSDAKITAIGGEGKEFYAGGENWSLNGPTQYLTQENRELMGQWRVEVTPASKNKYDTFLHVIQVGDNSLEVMDNIELLEYDTSCGVRLRKNDEIWDITFNTEGDLGGHITCIANGKLKVNKNFTNDVQMQNGIAAKPHAKMTYKEAINRIPSREIPDFWLVDNDKVDKYISELKIGKTSELARTNSGRALFLVEYGEHEPVERLANFNSAVGAHEVSAYMDKDLRKKPVAFFIGPVHGHELEGLAGLMNFINIIETGKDLRGISHSRLYELAHKCRLLILPNGNPDGSARFEPKSLQGMERIDIQFWGQGTWSSDNTLCGWPQSKRLHPMNGQEVGFLGCYFNNDGINPMHDEFFSPMGEEARVILEIARQEGPDITVSLHSFGNPPELLRPSWVPPSVQRQVHALAMDFYELCRQRQLPFSKSHNKAELTPVSSSQAFNMISAIYHSSGGIPFTFESPHGVKDGWEPRDECQIDFDDLVNIQLTLYETMLEYAISKKPTVIYLEEN